jgi:segregation and condensation protein A
VAPSPDGDVALASADDQIGRDQSGFRLTLSNFDGPFDLLVTLIAKHDLDITEVALSVVTNEFISYLHELDSDEELEQASEFLVVAATTRNSLAWSSSSALSSPFR